MIEGKAPTDLILTREDGRPVQDFRKRWARIRNAAGVPNLHLHDFRRTAIRAMVREGISRNVATKISGHKSDNIFDRYDITDMERDIDQAAQKTEERRKRLFDTNIDTAAPETVHS